MPKINFKVNYPTISDQDLALTMKVALINTWNRFLCSALWPLPVAYIFGRAFKSLVHL